MEQGANLIPSMTWGLLVESEFVHFADGHLTLNLRPELVAALKDMILDKVTQHLFEYSGQTIAITFQPNQPKHTLFHRTQEQMVGDLQQSLATTKLDEILGLQLDSESFELTAHKKSR